jgi:uncharacterized protein with von Willebrand factor type A (vWA) domain
LATELSGLVRSLRKEGVSVPADGVLVSGQALASVGLTDRDTARTALRAVMVSNPEDIATFDAIFEQFWDRTRRIFDGEAPESLTGEAAERPDDVFAPLGGDAGGHAAPATHGEAAPLETKQPEGEVRTRRAGGDTDQDNPEVTAVRPSGASPVGSPESVSVDLPGLGTYPSVPEAVGSLRDSLGNLQARRWRTGKERPDVRRALREGLATGGVPAELPERAKHRQAVRATVLVDVSRSVLDTIDRDYLIAVLQAMAAGWRHTRVFLFDTNLREVTSAMDSRHPSDAVQALEQAETEWGGGTRIGESFTAVRERHPEAIDRRTAVFIISDGLETGDVDELANGAAWMARRARILLWLNPLAADPDYEPSVRGMATVEPYLDGLFAFAGPGDLEEVARQIERRGVGGRLGYEFDRRRLTEG